MAAAQKYLNSKFLKTLEPLSKLGNDKLTELANKSSVEVFPAGRTIFRQGEKDKRCYYLVSGQIELQTTASAKTESLKAKTPEVKYPVCQQTPRPQTAKAKVNSELLVIDADLLEMLLESDDGLSGNYEVTEIGNDDENGWMLKFLQSRAFLQIPTENIQKILMSMEEVPAKNGDTIVTQGENNDYYYIVKHGKCSVSRRPSPNAADVQIAILAAGDGFGEEALITDGHRNATVRMVTDGTLMRLTKEDFMSLLVTPLLDYIHMDELKSRVAAGDLLVDVRPHKEFMENHLDGAINTPLSMIRLKLNNFNANRNTIVYCNDASKSTAAAFLLIQNGISCSILENGINNVATPEITGNKSTTSMTNIIANLEAVTSKPKAEASKKTANIAANKTSKVKQKIDQLNQEHVQTEAARKKALEEKRKIEEEKNRLIKEAQALREKAEAEKLAAEKELQRLAEEAKKHKREAEAKRQAELKAQKLREKAEAEKLAAIKQAQKLKMEAEAKRQAELEAKRLKEKTEKEKLEAERELQRQKKLTEESQRKVKLETEKIRKQADEELANLRKELQKTRSSVEERVKTLKEQEKLKAEEEIRNKQKHANDAIKESIEKARQQAAAEAEKVRQQALQEAQQLQQEIELKKQEIETEAERIRLEAERDRAETLELARKQAQDIVSRTVEEAEIINSKRQELDTAAEKIRIKAEMERKATLEAAKQEAHSIVRKTAEEAQQLEVQRLRIEEDVSRLKKEAELEKQRTLALVKEEAEKVRIELESELKQKALKEVEQVRRKTQQQAEELQKQRLAMEANLKQAEEIRIQAEKEAEKIRLEALNSASAAKTNVAEINQDEANGIAPPSRSFSGIAIPGLNTVNEHKTSMAESEAKSLAQEIVHKLEKAESARLKEQHETGSNSGLSLASASLKRRSDGKVVLDGEEDIFIFKEPQAASKEELSKLEASIDEMESTSKTDNVTAIAGKNKTAKTELPDFSIEEPEFNLVDEIPSHLSAQQMDDDVISEFSDFELHQPSDMQSRSRAVQKRPTQRIVAIAASLLVAIGAGITFIGVNSEQQTSTNNIAQQETDSFKATRVSGMATNNVEIDKKVINDAEHEFEKLLSKWKKSQQKKATETAGNTDTTDQAAQ